MRRFLSIVLALGLIVSLSLVTAVPALAVPEVWVDDDFTPATPGWGVDHFATIQEGIDAADSPGGVVHVADGYYTENIDLDDGVDVLGDGADNTTIDGGGSGSVVTATAITDATTTFDGFSVTNGTAGVGGGVYLSSSSLIVSNCRIYENTATSHGGGMYCINNSSPTVVNCIFEANTASFFGGGIYCSGAGSNPDITNCTIVGNTATGNGGGGIYLLNSSPTITNNIIASNTAPQGGGIYADGSADPDINYNDVWDNNPNDYFNCTPDTGNISSDPQFVDPGAGNYHLQDTSPCIDAGDNGAPGLPGTDFEGDPRIYPTGGTVDMGADEYYIPPPPPPPGSAVGGTVYPVNKAALLLPWIVLSAALVLAAGGLFLFRRSRP
jgi:parallel beta-helix repeat protein